MEEAVRRWNDDGPFQRTLRNRQELARFFDRVDLPEPGVVRRMLSQPERPESGPDVAPPSGSLDALFPPVAVRSHRSLGGCRPSKELERARQENAEGNGSADRRTDIPPILAQLLGIFFDEVTIGGTG
jgi:hypothetical protein